MAEDVYMHGSIVTVPEARYTKNGDLVVHFRMVQEDRYNANRTGNGPAEWKDREPGLFLDVDAWRQEWLAESDVKPGDGVIVRGMLRRETDYKHPKFDEILAKTGIEVMQKGDVKIEAREVAVTTKRRVVTTRNPWKDGTVEGRRQGGSPAQGGNNQWGGQSNGQQSPQGDPWAQPAPSAQTAPQQPPQGDPWAQHTQQSNGQQSPQGDPWAQHG